MVQYVPYILQGKVVSVKIHEYQAKDIMARYGIPIQPGRVAYTPEQARASAARVLGMDIKGLTVEKVLVVSKVDIKEEYYLGIILDRKSQTPVVMISKEGGIDIEQVAATAPEKIIKYPIDMRWGLRPFEARDIVAR